MAKPSKSPARAAEPMSTICDHATKLANLAGYRDRGMKRWFPELAEKA